MARSLSSAKIGTSFRCSFTGEMMAHSASECHYFFQGRTGRHGWLMEPSGNTRTTSRGRPYRAKCGRDALLRVRSGRNKGPSGLHEPAVVGRKSGSVGCDFLSPLWLLAGHLQQYDELWNNDCSGIQRCRTGFAHPGRRQGRLQPDRVALSDTDLLPGLQPHWPSRPERGRGPGNFHHRVEKPPVPARTGQTSRLALWHRPQPDSQKPGAGGPRTGASRRAPGRSTIRRRKEALPSEQAISREEEAILWRSLERIPELYREPLILFYREHQSIESVAAELELSEDAVKQRLSRGRKLLQEEVQAFVETALRRTAPGEAFSGAVLAALPQPVRRQRRVRAWRAKERRRQSRVFSAPG